MILKRAVLQAVSTGEVDTALRWWKRPTVRAGGTLTTAIGVLAIDELDVIAPDELTDDDARRAGYADADAARAALAEPPAAEGRRLHRVRFHLVGEDPRIALRADAQLDGPAIDDLLARLGRLDRRPPGGPWTAAVLALIRDRPATVSTDLASQLGMERADLKARIRKLKALGLTESLEVGYRLSPRGEALLDAAADPSAPGGWQRGHQ